MSNEIVAHLSDIFFIDNLLYHLYLHILIFCHGIQFDIPCCMNTNISSMTVNKEYLFGGNQKIIIFTNVGI